MQLQFPTITFALLALAGGHHNGVFAVSLIGSEEPITLDLTSSGADFTSTTSTTLDATLDGGVGFGDDDCLKLMAPIWKETIGNVDEYPYVDETVQILSQDDVTVTFSVNQLLMEGGTPMIAVNYRGATKGNDEVCDMNAHTGGVQLIEYGSAQEYTAQCTYGYADIAVYAYVGPKEEFDVEECEACAAPNEKYIGYYISVPCVPLCLPTIPPAPPTTIEVDCMGEIIETSSVTSLDFSNSVVKTNTLHLEDGELRYNDIGIVRDRPVSLVVTVASGDYTDIADVWAKRGKKPDKQNGKNGNFANINLQTVEGKPKSGEGNFKFCFHDMETDEIVSVDRFSFTVFDADMRGKGIEERMFMDTAQAQSFQLWPNAEKSEVKVKCEDGSPVPCGAGVRTNFASSTIGIGKDNPDDPDNMTDQQKSRSIAFQFIDTDCFEFTYDHFCPMEQIDEGGDGTSCEGYTGGNFLFGGSASEIITDGECVVTPTLAPATSEPSNEPTFEPTLATDEPTNEPTFAPTNEPTEAPTDKPTDAPVVPLTEPPIVTNGADDDTNDDTVFLPTCPEDVTLVTTVGETDWPTAAGGGNKPVVEIISQDTSTVTVTLNQEWTSSEQQSVESIFYSYKPSVWGQKCYEEQRVVGQSSFDTVTIQCNVLTPYAFLQICVADDASNGILSGLDNATIPKCCQSEEENDTPTVCYTVEIRCASLCVEASEESRMLRLRGSSSSKK